VSREETEDMFHTDRDIVRGHVTFKFEEDEEVPAWTSPITSQADSDGGGDGAAHDVGQDSKRCRAHCYEEGAIRKSSSPLHNSGACMQGATVEWRLGSSDNSC
jgi:hypothetical protein